jgi:hypothetical protein
MNFDENDPDWYNEHGESEDDDELFNDLEKEHERVENLPVMVKAKEIFDIVSSLVDTIPEDNDLYFLREQMLTDAAIISAKVAGAEGGELYTLKMENAVLIKLAARALITHTYTCRMFNISDERYLNILRSSVEEFRPLFVEWITTFDKSVDVSDNWGKLFR